MTAAETPAVDAEAAQEVIFPQTQGLYLILPNFF
jgi:hypothetical protein